MNRSLTNQRSLRCHWANKSNFLCLQSSAAKLDNMPISDPCMTRSASISISIAISSSSSQNRNNNNNKLAIATTMYRLISNRRLAPTKRRGQSKTGLLTINPRSLLAHDRAHAYQYFVGRGELVILGSANGSMIMESWKVDSRQKQLSIRKYKG